MQEVLFSAVQLPQEILYRTLWLFLLLQKIEDQFRCFCKSGFTGRQCNMEVDECASQPCVNGASCHDVINGFTCECPPGFTGIHCISFLSSISLLLRLNIPLFLESPAHHSAVVFFLFYCKHLRFVVLFDILCNIFYIKFCMNKLDWF